MSSPCPNNSFDEQDLEVIERTFNAVWTELNAREPELYRQNGETLRIVLRQKLFAIACFMERKETLLRDKLLELTPQGWQRGAHAVTNGGGREPLVMTIRHR